MTTTMQKLGITPIKGALIALLAIGMGWVWAPLILGESKPPRRVAVASAPKKSAVTKPAPAEKKRQAQRSEEPAAPSIKMTLAEATRHDPFAAPAWAPRPTGSGLAGAPASPDETRQRFEALATTGVAMVLVSKEGQAAQIGDRTVQVGDVIQGFRVVEISPAGVRFEPEEEGDENGA